MIPGVCQPLIELQRPNIEHSCVCICLVHTILPGIFGCRLEYAGHSPPVVAVDTDIEVVVPADQPTIVTITITVTTMTTFTIIIIIMIAITIVVPAEVWWSLPSRAPPSRVPCATTYTAPWHEARWHEARARHE